MEKTERRAGLETRQICRATRRGRVEAKSAGRGQLASIVSASPKTFGLPPSTAASPLVAAAARRSGSASSEELHVRFAEVLPGVVQVVGAAGQSNVVDGRRSSTGERLDVVELELIPGVASFPGGADVRAPAAVPLPDLALHSRRRLPRGYSQSGSNFHSGSCSHCG